MKKAMGLGATVFIVLGLVGMILIISIFAPKLYNLANNIFTKGEFSTERQEEPGVVVPGTVVGTTGGDVKTLSADANIATRELARETVNCFILLTKRNMGKDTRCGIIKVNEQMTGEIEKNKFVEELGKMGAEGDEMVSGEDEYNWNVEDKLVSYSEPFILCGSDGDEIYLTRDADDCVD